MRWVAPLALALAACPAPRTVVRPPPVPLAPADQHDEPALAGVFHVVQRGETVYRIARAYGVDPADLMETNGIPDPRSLAVGAELFVPGASRAVEVPPAPVPGDAAAATPTSAAPSPSPPPSPPPATATSSPDAAKAARTATSASPSTSRRAGAAAGPALAWPLKGILYGRYGTVAGRRHDGIDLAAPEGTAVGAAADGTVIYAGEQPGYGSIVILKHDGGLVTLYAHVGKILVREGRRVRRGEAVATVGQTGRTSGPHLHFEVRDGTRPRNPLLYLP